MTAVGKAWGAVALALALSAVGLLGVGASPASADIFTFDLTIPNTALSGFTGPYEAVTINRTSSTTANVTFNSLTNGGFIYLMGDSSAADLNVNASSFSTSSLACTHLTGFTCGPITNTGSGNVDGFGIFNLTTNDADGFTNSANQISYTLTDLSGTWSSASNVLAPNADGNIAAAHAFACAQPGCTPASGAAATGFVSAIPEPASLPLFSSGLLSLCGYGLIRRQRKPGWAGTKQAD